MLQGRGCIAVVLEIFVCLFNFAINASSKIINLNCSLGCNFFSSYGEHAEQESTLNQLLVEMDGKGLHSRGL